MPKPAVNQILELLSLHSGTFIIQVSSSLTPSAELITALTGQLLEALSEGKQPRGCKGIMKGQMICRPGGPQQRKPHSGTQPASLLL